MSEKTDKNRANFTQKMNFNYVWIDWKQCRLRGQMWRLSEMIQSTDVRLCVSQGRYINKFVPNLTVANTHSNFLYCETDLVYHSIKLLSIFYDVN